MNIQDVINDLKPQKRAITNDSAIVKRCKKHGIRTICLMCGFEGRHRPGDGRLRDRLCGNCGLKRLRARWWVEKYPTKAHAEFKRIRSTSFLLD